jgi:hypothetical protein
VAAGASVAVAACAVSELGEEGVNRHTECNAEGCHRSNAGGWPLFRVAPKGEIGPWACAEHVGAERAAWEQARGEQT